MKSLKGAMTRHRGTKALTTRSGKPSAAARRQYGAKSGSGLKKGSYPVYSTQTARSAIQLRGKAASKKAVLNKVAAYVRRSGNKTAAAMLSRARKVDAKGGKR
ncbi:MAG TPA: hypothetical protein VFL91_08505 [Thermomicrobiales bacterium]|nr:hypothetical protein [Thermomicrobiales bacterium]